MDLSSIAQAAEGSFDDSPYRQKYGEATQDLVDAPLYDDIDIDDHDLIMRNLYLAQMYNHWDEFVDYIKGVEDTGHRPNNKFAAVYEVEETHDTKGVRGFDVPKSRRPMCDRILAEYTRESVPDFAMPILKRWLSLLPLWECFGLSKGGDGRNEEYLWSPVRMLISGAGYERWAELVEVCERAYEHCPLDPQEEKGEWLKNMIDAHKMCGWPIQLIHVPYDKVRDWVPETTPGNAYGQPQWATAMAMLHVLKHVRTEPCGSIRVIHDGSLSRFHPREGAPIGMDNASVGHISAALGIPGPSKPKWICEPHKAMLKMLRRVRAAQLLTCRPLGKLEPCVLAGQWSVLEPYQGGDHTFTNINMQVDGVKIARDGKITTYHCSEEDVLDWEWNANDPHSDENLELRRTHFEELPDTYEIGLPMDIFRDAFPHMEIPTGCNEQAYLALLETPILASIVRQEWKPLRKEFPFVGLLPAAPSQDESTNQGKSTALTCYARSLVPGIDLVNAPDSNSAPDTRSIGTRISEYGTVALDEFVLPKSVTHPLAKNSMQALCTGSMLNSGRILKDFGSIRLSHSLLISAKFLELPPDMLNRSLIMLFNNLTDEMRDDWSERYGEDSDQVSLAMRFAAIALTEDEEFWPLLKRIPVASRHYLRFGGHRALAALLYMARVGDDNVESALAVIDDTYHNLLGRFHSQTAQADEEGLIADVDLGRIQNLRLASLVMGLQAGHLNEIRQSSIDASSQRGGRFGNKDLVRAIVEAHMKNTESLARSVNDICGGNWRSDNQLARAMGKDLRAHMSKDGLIYLPEPFAQSGWAIVESGSSWAWQQLKGS